MQTEISSFKNYGSLMPTKTTGKGLQRVTSRVCYITNPDKPCPGNTQQRGRGMLRCFREEEEKPGMHVTIYSYESWFCLLTILWIHKFQIIKAAVLNTVTLSPCSASLSLSLTHTHTHTHTHSLSHSDRQISSNKLFQLYTYFHTAMRSIINGHACGCCAVLKL